MGRALVTKRIVSLCQKEEQYNAMLAVHFTVKNRLTSCTLLKRRSSSVSKVGMLCGLWTVLPITSGRRTFFGYKLRFPENYVSVRKKCPGLR